MKFPVLATVLILSAGIPLPASANSNSTSSGPGLNSPSSIEPVSVDARDLTVETMPRDNSNQSAERSEQLSEQAQQINRNLSTRQESPQLQQQIRELLDLPDGMIIRGGSRGGIGVGSEF
jgi:hypothetical protein